jgi:acetyl esterase/lipase
MSYPPDHIVNQSGPAGVLKINYGMGPDEVVEFYGNDQNPVVVFLIHGGFWRPTIDRSHLQLLSAALAEEGHYIGLIEYRRVQGQPTQYLTDILSAILKIKDKKIILFGHSAGGQLAILAAREIKNCIGVVAASPVADLVAGELENLGDGAINLYLGGKAKDFQELDPMRVSPPKCRVEIIHTENDFIPKHVAQNYYDLHKSNHENIGFTLIDNADHYTLIDPRGSGFEKLIKVLADMQKVSSGEIK